MIILSTTIQTQHHRNLLVIPNERINANKQRYKNKSQHFNKPTESLQKSPESSIMADDDVTDHQVQQQTTDRDNSTNLNMTTVTTTTPPPPPPPPQHAQEANVYKSPRKEAIMRYKQNHDNTFNQLFDIKENLKSKKMMINSPNCNRLLVEIK